VNCPLHDEYALIVHYQKAPGTSAGIILAVENAVKRML
jgi:hypothetical protein